MRYFKNILNYDVLFDEFQEFYLVEYSDSDWRADLQDRKSMTEFLIKIAGGPVFWHSTKQTGISLSSTETEYIAAFKTAKNIITICDILVKLDVILTNFAFSLLIDNTESIVINENKKIIWNIRHVDICYHHIRDLIQNDMIEVLHILSRDMTANRLIKTLNIIKFKEFCDLIELLNESLDIDKNDNDSFNDNLTTEQVE